MRIIYEIWSSVRSVLWLFSINLWWYIRWQNILIKRLWLATYQTFWATHTGSAREQQFSFENPGSQAYNLCPCCRNSWKCDYNNTKVKDNIQNELREIQIQKWPKFPKWIKIWVRNIDIKKVTRSQCHIQTTPTKMATTTTAKIVTTTTTLKTREQRKQHYK